MNFLGIDLGTSSVKIIIMDEKGVVKSSISKEYPVYYPKDNWAEQNPIDWWNAVKEGINDIINKSSIDSSTIKSVGFSGQMHGLTILDKNNEVIMPAILWCDQRTSEECDYLNNVIGQEKISEFTGNKALTGFTAPKILWLKKHKPEQYNKIAHALLPKDYIRFMLTGEYATDVSDASGTLYFDVKNRRWSKEMLDILGLTEDVMPRIYESWEVTGKISKQAALETGLAEGTLVVGGAGDQAAGAIGTGTVKSGIISTALGTSGVVFACQDTYAVDKDNRLHSFCHSNGKWHVMGVMLSAAACLKWWVENINKDTENPFEVLLGEAENIAPGSGGLYFLPYLMGERTPYSDPNAKGSFVGLNITHDRANMTRALLEGVSFGLNDSLEIIRELNIPVKEVRVNGGGAKSKLWKQILADIFNARIDVINATEGPAYGAAILASVGAGLFNSVDEACEKLIKVTESTYPITENVEKYRKHYKIYSKLYGDLKDRFKEISQV